MELQIWRVDRSRDDELEEFCQKASAHGYVNNHSIKAMKIDQMHDERLAFWALRRNDQILGVAGCHVLPEVGDGYFRVLFRSCVLPNIGFRAHFCSTPIGTSPLWRWILPQQILWAKRNGGSKFIISVNCGDDRQPLPMKMSKVKRAMDRLAIDGLVTLFMKQAELYHSRQDLYLVNESALLRVLSRYPDASFQK